MNMICKWVHADDGALIMEWAVTLWDKAGGSQVQWGTGDSEVAHAFEVSDDHAGTLTPIGV